MPRWRSAVTGTKWRLTRRRDGGGGRTTWWRYAKIGERRAYRRSVVKDFKGINNSLFLLKPPQASIRRYMGSKPVEIDDLTYMYSLVFR